MILTDKAKNDFIIWSKNQKDLLIGVQIPNTIGGTVLHLNSNIEILPKRILNHLIIEWFDSVGVTVDVMPILNNPLKFMPNTFWLEKEFSMTDEEVEYFESRQEATLEAIKKANEIYNIHFMRSNEAE